MQYICNGESLLIYAMHHVAVSAVCLLWCPYITRRTYSLQDEAPPPRTEPFPRYRHVVSQID